MVAERAGTQANFQLSVVRLPAEDDEVIEDQGARVFLEPEAASLLDDKILDASFEQNQVAHRGPARGVAGEFAWHGEVSRTSRRISPCRLKRSASGLQPYLPALTIEA
jgi:hypothetical protein